MTCLQKQVGVAIFIAVLFIWFFAFMTYSAHAMCYEYTNTCYALNQLEKATQKSYEPGASQPPGPAGAPELSSVWPSQEIQCRREREMHAQLDRWATAADRGKSWPATPWCEKYAR